MFKEYIMCAEIKFIDGKFVGFVNGKAMVKSINKYYVEKILDGQKSNMYVRCEDNLNEKRWYKK